jgi:hypothetical protein
MFDKQKFDNDYQRGKESEISLLSQLKNILSNDIELSVNPHCPFDFIGLEHLIELKTRFNTSTKYPTTMIGYNKIVEANKECNAHKRILFFFRFTDKLMFIEYDKEVFKKYQVKEGGRCDRGKIERSLYVYIPVCDLMEF